MCGRATLTKSVKAIEKRFQALFELGEWEEHPTLPNYNIAPTHWHPVITNQEPKVIHMFRWGLVPFWAKDEKIGYRMINARIETVLEKPAYKQAIRHRRCLVPLDGFYEWKKSPEGKIPYRIGLQDEGLFSVAGLWESWKGPDGIPLPTFTILTQAPNALCERIHDRMPALLTPEQEPLWLDDSIPPRDLVSMITPYPEDEMMAYRVSTRVNRVSENDPELIRPEG